MTVLVGRDAELDRLLAGLAEGGPRCLVLAARPGMGKTSVVQAFLDAAAGSVTTWSARPLEAESTLAFSGLADLLTDVPPTRYDALPAPQRTAMRAALLLEDAGVEVDPRAVAAALRAVVRATAEAGPLLLVVDDAHWLDDATAHALAQGLGRLPRLPVCVLAATRPTGRPVSEWLPSWDTDEIDLPPLTAAALFHLVREHLGRALDRGALRAVEAASGGNPLHALEFARHHGRPGGSTFEHLLEDRLGSLPRPTRLLSWRRPWPGLRPSSWSRVRAAARPPSSWTCWNPRCVSAWCASPTRCPSPIRSTPRRSCRPRRPRTGRSATGGLPASSPARRPGPATWASRRPARTPSWRGPSRTRPSSPVVEEPGTRRPS